MERLTQTMTVDHGSCCNASSSTKIGRSAFNLIRVSQNTKTDTRLGSTEVEAPGS